MIDTTAERITSTQNPKIKNVLLLQQKSSERRRQRLFVVEGQREIMHCVEAGYTVRTLFVCPEICGNEIADNVIRECGKAQGAQVLTQGPQQLTQGSRLQVLEVSRQVYEKMAYRAGTEGMIGVIEAQQRSLADLQLPDNPLLVVLESVEKPGNLGAVLRSADASGADAVIVCDPLTDLYNPNLIRSSIGSAFTVPVVACTSEECISFLKSYGVRILTAQLQDSELYYDTDMRCGTAIIMGTESTGLTDIWRKAADAHIRIPMFGRLDSLNVSVSAAILLYEAVRQRN